MYEETKIDLSLNRDKIFYQQCDIQDLDQINKFMDSSYEHFGAINTACIHAGIVSVTPILEETEQELRRILDTNIVGSFLFAQSAAKSMVKHW